MAQELLNCPNPNCKSKEVFISGDLNWAKEFWIECEDCEMTGPKAKKQIYAAKAWNSLLRPGEEKSNYRCCV